MTAEGQLINKQITITSVDPSVIRISLGANACLAARGAVSAYLDFVYAFPRTQV